MKTINLDEKLNQFSSHWNPHVVADYNNNDVMVVRFIGEYPFHKHETTDDFFYVLQGEMEMENVLFGNRNRAGGRRDCGYYRLHDCGHE